MAVRGHGYFCSTCYSTHEASTGVSWGYSLKLRVSSALISVSDTVSVYMVRVRDTGHAGHLGYHSAPFQFFPGRMNSWLACRQTAQEARLVLNGAELPSTGLGDRCEGLVTIREVSLP